ncbi:LamG domain-containing protein [Lentzea sp. HUAS12]|uniref:LamG domain-containing protein n=1 Tax=Lentzea sp. HUAS12 TaxID=2951806 RepID=UPI00209F6863|nr:LamG domain-containing protein [Lentzea sp. HUAS12]USX53761.1 LamG domain-containing protein [Lentzea sp. HUAS12]
MARWTTGAGWRRLAAATAVVLGAGVITAVSWPDAVTPPVAAEANDTALALQTAHESGEAVAVPALTTPTRTVSAQPDGTLRAELTTAPTRWRKNGTWVGVDPALTGGPAGTLVPKSAGVDVALSNGGKAPLLTIGTPGRSAALTWPGELPAPLVDGATATYRDVLPGVDLVLRTQANGVTQHVVVKDAKAKPESVRFGLVSDGLTVRATKDGGLEAVDGKGEVVLATPPTIMWDAAGTQARVGLRVDSSSVELLPDQELLKTGQYPVTIDPDWWTNDRKDWTKVFSGKPDSTHWYGADDVDSWAKVGTCTGWAGCNGIGVARSYFQFDTSFLRGKRIISADFNATVVHGPQCVTSDHQLWIANATFGPGTTWNNAPGGTFVDSSPAGSNYTGCEGYKPVGFTVGQYINPNGWSAYFLRAANEGDKSAWRKYDAGATKITVNYNSRPDAPTQMVTDPPLTICKWCGGVAYTAQDNIRIKGKLTDAENDQLTAIWDVYGGPQKQHVEGPTLGAGNTFSTNVDLSGRNGQHVTWTLWGRDAADGSDWKNGPGFVVDRVGIDKEPGVVAGLYTDDNRWHGGVGVPGRFTFDSAGVSDVDHYLYDWVDPPKTPVDAEALGGRASVDIAPKADGTQTLFVQSVDRAGNASPTRKVKFNVRGGNGPLAQWSFDGNGKDSAFLGDRDATLNGGASYTAAGAVGSAVQFDGTTGSAAAPNTVRTDASFTASAWVRLAQGNTHQAVLSQDGEAFAGLNLWYRASDGRWAFAMVNPAADDKWSDWAWSAAPAQIGVWTHLTAVYDLPSNEIRLYVNGEPAGSAKRLSAPVNTTGQFRIGKTLWDSQPDQDRLAGAVDEVKVYDRVLSDAEIRASVGRDAVQAGNWKFDETSGTAAGNAVLGSTAAELKGSAKFVGQGAVGGAVQFPDPTGYVTAGKPVVRTDQSFSVSAWVRQDETPPLDWFQAAVSQDGTRHSGFFLGYRSAPDGAGRWEFVLPTADVAGPGYETVFSPAGAKLGEWTHLTGVYDAQAKQIRLFVNGEQTATAARTQGFNATGALTVGRGRAGGNPGHEWRGSLDEVRVFSRAIGTEEVRGIVARDNVAVGSWKFDGGLQDSSPRALHGTATGAVSYVAGQATMPDAADQALGLDGASSVSTPHGIDADRSFAVAAWAKVDAAGLATVLSQDGPDVSGFTLRARADGKWGLQMGGRDEAAGGAVQPGQWTHLVGVHDVTAKQILLYVNGVQVASAAHTQTGTASGGLLVGRSKAGEFFKGAIDDVSAYSRVLYATEIQTMSGKDLTLVHHYRFDGTGADASGNRPATLGGDAVIGAGRLGAGLVVTGAGAATTTGTDVRLDQPFTVSAWVRFSGKDCAERVCRSDAVTVDGARSSKFRLGHVIDDDNNQLGAWTFDMPESDLDNAKVTKAAVSTLPSETDKWTFLVGVYDPVGKKMWLYVNGTRVGDGTLDNAWAATGGVAIGRGKANGAPAEFWKGGVDDVRLYTGQLDKDRITGLFRSYPAVTG